MISDEERSRVAANLASEAQAWRDTFPDEVCDLGDVPALMQDLCHFAGLRGKVSCGGIFQRFADLIDRPTCTVSMGVTGHVGVCMRCGAMIETRAAVFNAIEALPTRYCPNCGAELAGEPASRAVTQQR